MTSFNLRFIAAFAVVAGLTLVLVACGNKFELRTEAEAIAYTKSNVLSYYNRHPDKFSGDCPLFLNLAIWGASKRSSGSVRWSVHAVGTGLPEPRGVQFDPAAWKRYRESQGGEETYWIYDDGKIVNNIFISGLSSCSGYRGYDPNP